MTKYVGGGDAVRADMRSGNRLVFNGKGALPDSECVEVLCQAAGVDE